MRHTYQSPAKINWFLHITRRRAAGYHSMETVFQRIDWCDEIHITPNHDGQIYLSDSASISVNDNLIYRAALALKAHLQQRAPSSEQAERVAQLGADIELKKNIPMGAGLGGGSSDAATTLIALNDLWQAHLDNATLQGIGLTLGADVPFFISPYSAAFARGVGEELTPMALAPRELLLVKPNVHADTRLVYQHPLLVRDHAPLETGIHDLERQLQRLDAHAPFSNDMQSAAFIIAPEIEAVYKALQAVAPQAYVCMSGSGATVFACPNTADERAALAQWQTEQCPSHWLSRWCKTLG